MQKLRTEAGEPIEIPESQKYHARFFVIFCVVVLTGCHTLSKQQCEAGDWARMGREDAIEGRAIKKRYETYRKDCSEHGIAVDKEKYLAGYEAGAAEFCTEANGRWFARAGKVYEETCPSRLSENFLRGYTPARRVYLAEEARREAQEAEQKKKQDKLDWVEGFLRDHNTKTCTFNSECHREGKCTFSKCEHDDSKCTFNSDCKEEGRCNNTHECWRGSCERIEYCKYD